MVPPPGLVLGRVAVESERRAVGEVRLRNGHIARDCWRRDSMGDNAIVLVSSIELEERECEMKD